MSDLNTCPRCGGDADNGHDREYPPNPYLCSKCEGQPVPIPNALVLSHHEIGDSGRFFAERRRLLHEGEIWRLWEDGMGMMALFRTTEFTWLVLWQGGRLEIADSVAVESSRILLHDEILLRSHCSDTEAEAILDVILIDDSPVRAVRMWRPTPTGEEQG